MTCYGNLTRGNQPTQIGSLPAAKICDRSSSRSRSVPSQSAANPNTLITWAVKIPIKWAPNSQLHQFTSELLMMWSSPKWSSVDADHPQWRPPEIPVWCFAQETQIEMLQEYRDRKPGGGKHAGRAGSKPSWFISWLMVDYTGNQQDPGTSCMPMGQATNRPKEGAVVNPSQRRLDSLVIN